MGTSPKWFPNLFLELFRRKQIARKTQHIRNSHLLLQAALQGNSNDFERQQAESLDLVCNKQNLDLCSCKRRKENECLHAACQVTQDCNPTLWTEPRFTLLCFLFSLIIIPDQHKHSRTTFLWSPSAFLVVPSYTLGLLLLYHFTSRN